MFNALRSASLRRNRPKLAQFVFQGGTVVVRSGRSEVVKEIDAPVRSILFCSFVSEVGVVQASSDGFGGQQERIVILDGDTTKEAANVA